LSIVVGLLADAFGATIAWHLVDMAIGVIGLRAVAVR
jgi:hypothetical protein